MLLARMNSVPESGGRKARLLTRKRKLQAAGFVIVQLILWTGVVMWEPRDTGGPMKVAAGLWPGSETLTIARERGMLNDDDVRVIEMTWSSAAMRAFGNRVVDAAVLTLDEALRLRENGHDARIVFPMDISAGADALVSLGAVNDVRSLQGKRVGVELRTAGMYLLARALEERALSFDDLTIVPLNLAETESSLIEGEVDAVVTAEPWLSRLKEAGAMTLFDSRQAPDQLCRVLVARGDVVEKFGDELAMLVSTHLRILGEITKNLTPSEIETICRREGLTRGVFDRALLEMRRPDGKDALQMMEGSDTGSLNGIADRVVKFMQERELLRRAPDRSRWLDSSILRRVLGR